MQQPESLQKPNLPLFPSHPKKYCVSKLHIYSQKRPIVCNHCLLIFLMCRYAGYLLSVSPGPLSIFLHSALSWSAGLQKPCHQDSHDLWFLGFGQREPWQEIKEWDEHEIRVCIPLRGSFGWTCPFSWLRVPFQVIFSPQLFFLVSNCYLPSSFQISVQ